MQARYTRNHRPDEINQALCLKSLHHESIIALSPEVKSSHYFEHLSLVLLNKAHSARVDQAATLSKKHRDFSNFD